MKLSKFVVLLPLMLLLGGCNMVVMDPAGDVARQQRDLILISAFLMLLIIIPVMALTVLFAWKYRQSANNPDYDPEWHHSTRVEIMVWAAPLAIIIALGAITWVSTHTLDPYRPLARISPSEPVTAETKELTVEVVSLNWKWLFIYPEYGVATVNEMAAPVDMPINFKITSSNIMNSFFIPALAGQIYSMAGMETKLHAVINKPGIYEGFSSNYSGAGFSDMRFKFHALSADGFRAWIAKAKESGNTLNRRSYLKLAKPSIANPVQYYASVQSDLYDRILNQCVDGSRMCIKDEMAYDLRDGGGLFGPSCTTAGTGVGGSDDLKYQPKRTASQRPIYLDASVLLDRIF